MSVKFRSDKTTALTSIEKLLVFTKNLNEKYPDMGFENTVSEISRVKEILSQATDRCLTDSQIDAFRRFGDMLTNNTIFGSKHFNSPNIQSKLLKFWSICGIILYAPNPLEIIFWRLNPTLSKEDQVKVLINSLEAINRINAVASLVVTEVRNNPNSILAITSILLTLTIRKETHEYELNNILRTMVKSTNMNVDIEDLLSVESKVQRDGKWKTDVNAIRDAIAHAKFKINSTNYQITFENIGKGYSFVLTKTGEELLFFYQDYDKMLHLQSKLLSITLLIALLKADFRIN
jgi:hypothetical protein